MATISINSAGHTPQGNGGCYSTPIHTMPVVNNSEARTEPIAAGAVQHCSRPMMHETEPDKGSHCGSPGYEREFTPKDDAYLRDTLKRFPPSTREAACEFRRTGSLDHLPAIVHGLIEHYVERGARAKLSKSDDGVRLVEDLAIDSLTMLEIVFLAEDVLQISIDNEELRPFRTVGDIKRFIASKLAHARA
jgi:acyl carrier protein